ncbi:MAG: DNA mismatch repair protein MutS, partial [Acidobacteria bacterium]
MRPRGLPHVLLPEPLKFDERMRLDASAIATLELFESSEGDSRASLCSLLDRTRTPMGARALKDAISRPSLDPVELEDRWDAVGELLANPDVRGSIQAALDGIGDLERSFGRIAVATAGPRDVAAWAAGLRRIPALCTAAEPLVSSRLRRVIDGLPDVSDLAARAEQTIAPDPPVLVSAGGAIRSGADAELDSLRELRRGAQGTLLEIEAEERRRSGIATLKIRYNRVFGYSLEVGAAHRDRVPADWIRRQSLANAERFVTPALKELEEKILGAEERIGGIEARLFADLLTDLAS